MPRNERKTENLVRDLLRRLRYVQDGTAIRVEEQRSEVADIRRGLRAASKNCSGNVGAPEFIISNSENPEFVVLIECKASIKDHRSDTATALLNGTTVEENEAAHSRRVCRFAVDGALHYADALSGAFNVVAVAVSGETSSALEISTYLHARGAKRARVLKTKDGRVIEGLLPWDDYVEHATFDPSLQKLRHDELMSFARELHDFMRDHAKLTESEKPLLVSGTLIALKNTAFAQSYDLQGSPEDLQQEWLKVISAEIYKADIRKANKASMVQPYSSIAVHPKFKKATKTYPKGVLNELIRRLKEKVWPFISVYRDFDVVGQFYGEFLKYTGGDKKSLGIVLTPRHITELFALLAGVTRRSKVLDICAGTGGFLISAMQEMFRDAETQDERDAIRSDGLVGVEDQPNMYALAASNMILRGDGKANLYQGDCFDPKIVREIKGHKCDVGLLNPPFSQKEEDLHELFFVKQLLDCLVVGGRAVVIVPMSCAISPHDTRREILKSHTLDGVMSLPDDLFYPVGTVTCAMVFTAHKPHAETGRKTWFGYWKNDGFLKTKHRGRVDHGTWPYIRDRWVQMFKDREKLIGESVLQNVTHEDEWCAEAYMKTDYSKLKQAEFEKVVRDYAVFRLVGASPDEAEDEEETSGDPEPVNADS